MGTNEMKTTTTTTTLDIVLDCKVQLISCRNRNLLYFVICYFISMSFLNHGLFHKFFHKYLWIYEFFHKVRIEFLSQLKISYKLVDNSNYDIEIKLTSNASNNYFLVIMIDVKYPPISPMINERNPNVP